MKRKGVPKNMKMTKAWRQAQKRDMLVNPIKKRDNDIILYLLFCRAAGSMSNLLKSQNALSLQVEKLTR